MTEVQQWEQFENVLAGATNFCIVERRKAPKLYDLLASSTIHGWGEIKLLYNHSLEGDEVVVHRPGFYQAYRDLIGARKTYKRYEFQIAFGTLLGYDLESCLAFAADPVDCSCSKCGGRESASDEIERLQWVQRGQPHPRRVDEDKVYADNGWAPEYPETSELTDAHGNVLGTLQSVDPAGLINNPALQSWSRPEG